MTAKSMLDRIEIFARAIVEGKTQADAYREAYPKSRNWVQENVSGKGAKMAKDVRVLTRVKELRTEITKNFTWTKEMSLKVLAKIATDKTAKNPEKISAVKELNVMYGYNAPTKLDHSSSDGTMSPKPLDLSKLSENTMKELLEAKEQSPA